MKNKYVLPIISTTLLLQTPMVFAGVASKVFDVIVTATTNSEKKIVHRVNSVKNATDLPQNVTLPGGYRFNLPPHSDANIRNNILDITQRNADGSVKTETLFRIDEKTLQTRFISYHDQQIEFKQSVYYNTFSIKDGNNSRLFDDDNLNNPKMPFSAHEIVKVTRSTDPSEVALIFETKNGKVYKLKYVVSTVENKKVLSTNFTEVQSQVPTVGFKRPALRNATN